MGAVRERRPSSDSSTTEGEPRAKPGTLRYLDRSMGRSVRKAHRATVHRLCSASISRLISTAINPGNASTTANRANVIIAIMINLPSGWARRIPRAREWSMRDRGFGRCDGHHKMIDCIKKTEACVKSFKVQLCEVFHTTGAGYDPFALESPASAGLILSALRRGRRSERVGPGIA
jgi:hypothetical protein